MSGIGFDEAIKYLKQGGRVSRDGWNGKGMWLEVQRPDPDSKMSRSYIFMVTVDSQLVPWVASQSDLLCDDWNLHPKKRIASNHVAGI